jgi:putative two-component system response regulator
MMELKIRTNSLLREKDSREALKQYQAELEETVSKRTEALRQSLKETAEAQRRTYRAQLETIERLALAAEHRDKETAFHIKRMSYYCHLIAKKLGLPPQECEIILNATPMHDVGKIGIPDAILLKPGKLDPTEWEIMKKHAEIGALILSGSSSDLLQAGEIVARSHHERWDGTGYPLGLSGENIPLWGRITALADVFDALTNKRPYKDAFPNDMAIQIMKEARGVFFDPKLLDIFLDNLADVYAIQEKYKDTNNPDDDKLSF